MTLPCGAEVAAEAAVRTVGDDDEACAHGRVARGAVVEFGIDRQGGTADEPPLDDRRRRLVAHQHDRSGLGGAGAQVCVEDVAAKCVGVVRQTAVARPRCGHLALAVDQAHAGEPVCPQRCRVDAEHREFVQRSRRDRIATGLVARDRALLGERDVMAGAGQPRGDRRPGRTPADDEDVGVQSVLCQPADGGEPGMASGPIGMISAGPMSGASGEV